MLQIPFKVKPSVEKVEVGNEKVGIIEIPKLGDFTPAERIFISENSGASSRKLVVSFAAKMAKVMGKSITDVYQMAVDYLSSQSVEELENHLEAFADFQEEFQQTVEKNNYVKAVAILRRVCPEADLDNSGELHPQLMQELIEFAIKEESGWSEQDEQPEPTEEELGKSQSPQRKNQTGKKSSGE